MQPEMMYFEDLVTEPIFEAPSVEPEAPKTETKTENKIDFVERFTDIPVEIVKDLGFFAVLFALLFGLPVDTNDPEMV